MAYHITTFDSQKLALERDSSGFSSRLFVVVGSFFLLIGVGLNIFMDTWEVPFILFRILFPFFGCVAIAAGLYLPTQSRNTVPEQITFDHNQGAIIIEMMKGGNETGYIRYDEVEGFDFSIERQSSSSSTSSQTNTTYYTYHVFLKKKDGGEWFLTTLNSQDKAEAAVAIFRSQVPLDKPFTISAPAKLTTKISRQDGADKTMLHWQNKVSFLMPVFLVVFTIVFFSIIGTVFSMSADSGIDYFMYVVGGFILLIYFFVMFSIVKKLLKDASTRYALAVSKTQFEYYEFSKTGGAMKNHKALPIETVDRIVYSFNSSKPTLNSTLTVMTKEDVNHLQKTKENPLTALKDVFTGQNQPITLSITALNPVECLQVESWLQDLILKKSDKKVL